MILNALTPSSSAYKNITVQTMQQASSQNNSNVAEQSIFSDGDNLDMFSRLPIELLENIVKYLPTGPKQLIFLLLINKNSYQKIQRLLSDGIIYDINTQLNWGRARMQYLLSHLSSNSELRSVASNIIFNELKNKNNIALSFSKGKIYGLYTGGDMLLNVLDAIVSKEHIKNLYISINLDNSENYSTDDIASRIISILERKPNFIRIKFNSSINTSNENYIVIPESESNKEFSKICISNSPIKTGDIINLLSNFKDISLTILQLENIQMGNKNLKYLIKNLSEKITTLSIPGNNIDSIGINYLFKYSTKNVKHINLSRNKIANNSIENILNLIENTKIKVLFLCKNPITESGAFLLISEAQFTNLINLTLCDSEDVIKRNHLFFENIKNEKLSIWTSPRGTYNLAEATFRNFV